ncbi:hypothetical protein GCM10023322_63470 [Rugosimonospora acidiphila]|uniref:FtsX-like permease family protein n=1 Tax=Rugosimonospora acidiphila TaxID=556531 RepID=A0ABP9SIK8_9ACTN
MRPGTLLRLAVTGTRADTTRIALTGFGSALGALALLCAATVLAIRSVPDPTEPGRMMDAPYTNGLLRESGLRPGLAFALILLTVPVLLFVGQCARLGAPARDRRLAAIRLAGATPGQGLAMASVESGAATLLGAVAGLLCYLAGRHVFDEPNAHGLRPLPTDVLPAPGAIAAIVFGLPLIATLVTALLLRRVAVTPFGVARRTRTRPPRPLPGVLIVLGVVGYALIPAVQRHDTALAGYALPLVVFLGGLAAAVGVVSGAGWISYTVGRLLARYARRPAALIAARRLQADPWHGSRALAALLGAVLIAGAAAWYASWSRTDQRVNAINDHLAAVAFGEPTVVDSPNNFYLRAAQLAGYGVLLAGLIAAAGLAVAVANSVVERRRALASLTASGVPRGVLGRAVLWQTVGVAVPALILAMATGVALGRGVEGSTVGDESGTYSCTAPPDAPQACNLPLGQARQLGAKVIEPPHITEQVPVPWGQLGVIGGWALGATVLTAGLGMVFLRASTAPEELRTS